MGALIVSLVAEVVEVKASMAVPESVWSKVRMLVEPKARVKAWVLSLSPMVRLPTVRTPLRLMV